MQFKDYEEYIKSPDVSKREKGYAWYTAIGLQQVDGLETSDYLYEIANKNINGDISIREANELIKNYYSSKEGHTNDSRTNEADTVSVRISEMIQEKSFVFSARQYISIHKRLFDGIYNFAGKIRDYNISKKEWVLDGDTVIYGNSYELKEALEYDLEQEKKYSYANLSNEELIKHLASFISGLWQIHLFGEGNTRTTAVFLILYLNTLGFNVTNDLFAKNSWYFRNALVRANYNNIKNNIHETTEYLEMFLENLIFNKNNELKNRDLHVSNINNQYIEDKVQYIEDEIQYIENKIQDIEKTKKLDIRFKNNVKMVYDSLHLKEFFGRNDVMNVTGLSSAAASSLIKNMINYKLIDAYTGRGKGKYHF